MILGVDEGIKCLRCESVVTFPTETFFGVGADPFSAAAVEGVATLKSRDLLRGIPLICSDTNWIEQFIASEEPAVREARRKLQEQYWPGALTLVFTVRADAQSRFPALLFGPEHTLAVRYSSHPIACALAAGVGGAITSTSANLTGEVPALTAEEAERIFPHVPAIAGKVGGETLPSTILDVRRLPFALLRPGAITLS